MTVNVHFFEPALDRLLNQPTGPVGRHMKKIGLQIYAGALRMAGRDTGDLVRKMYMKQGRRGRYQYVEVGSTSGHAYVHHKGTKPHLIRPETGRVLRFNVGGHVVYARQTIHPGTKPNHYLTVPMRRAVRG